MKKWLWKSVSVLVLVGLTAALAVGVAFAQEEGPQGRRAHRGGAHVIGQMADATGLSAEQIVEQLQAGQTPREILTANGVDADAFVSDVLAEVEARLDEAVSNGRIDQATADEMLANAETRLTEALDQTFEDIGTGVRKPGGRGRGVVRGVLEATGLTGEELRAELESGQTLADVLTANGVSVDAFVSDQLMDLETRLNEAVSEDKIDQAQADEMLSNAEERLPEMLNQTFDPESRPEGGQGPGGDRRGPGPGDGPIGGGANGPAVQGA